MSLCRHRMIIPICAVLSWYACGQILLADPSPANPAASADAQTAADRAAVQANPNDPVAHNNLGVDLAAAGKLDESIKELREAVRLKPDYAEAHFDLGADLDQQNQLDEALTEYLAAVKDKPDFLEAHRALARLLDYKHKDNEAGREYKQIIALSPDDLEAHQNLATVYRRSLHFADAIKEDAAVLRLTPNDVAALQAAASDNDILWKHEQAAQDMQKAIALKPDDPQLHYFYGVVLEEKRDYDAAVTEERKTVALAPEMIWARMELGTALWYDGKRREGRSEWKNVLVMGNPDAAGQAQVRLDDFAE